MVWRFGSRAALDCLQATYPRRAQACRRTARRSCSASRGPSSCCPWGLLGISVPQPGAYCAALHQPDDISKGPSRWAQDPTARLSGTSHIRATSGSQSRQATSAAQLRKRWTNPVIR